MTSRFQILSTCVVLFAAMGCGLNHEPENRKLLARAQAIYTTDSDRAVNWAKRAADSGHVPAMIALGNHYADGNLRDYLADIPRVHLGLDSEMNPNQRAAGWFRRALDISLARRDTTDLMTAALITRGGFAGSVNREQAIKLVDEAARRGMGGAERIAMMWKILDKRQQSGDSQTTRVDSLGTS